MTAADFLSRHGLTMPPLKLAKVQGCPSWCKIAPAGHYEDSVGVDWYYDEKHNHGPLYRVTIRRTEAMYIALFAKEFVNRRKSISFNYWVTMKDSVFNEIFEAELWKWLLTVFRRPLERKRDKSGHVWLYTETKLHRRVSRFFTTAELAEVAR